MDVPYQPGVVLDTISNEIAYLKSKDLRQAKACSNSCDFEGLGIILFTGQTWIWIKCVNNLFDCMYASCLLFTLNGFYCICLIVVIVYDNKQQLF